MKDSVVIEIRTPNYEIERAVIPIEDNLILRYNSILRPAGSLVIKNVKSKNDVQGEVFLDGQRVAKIPYKN